MLRFADSFDHYGSIANMSAGLWAELTQASISSAQSRTGGNSLLLTGGGGGAPAIARLALNGPALDVIGVGFGIYFPALPSINNNCLFQLASNANSPLLTMIFNPSGSITINKGDYNGSLIEVTDNLITAGTFHHIELRAFMDDTAGEFELHVNGVVQLQLGSLDLGTTKVSQSAWRRRNVGGSADPQYIDDIFVWDETGDFNNTFMGPLRILTTFADGESSPQDWTAVGASTIHEAIDEVPPDGDTSYAGAGTVGNKATLTLPEIPPEVDKVAGIYVPALARIDEAGTGSIVVSMISGSESINGGESTPLTTSYSYWPFAFDYDPNTNAQWTKSTFEAAKVQIEKTA